MSYTRLWLRAVGIVVLMLALWGCDGANDATSISGASSTPSLATLPTGVPVYTVTSIDGVTDGGGSRICR